MFGLQPLHLIIILAITLLIFGPSRLSGIGRALGTMLKEFRAATHEPVASDEEKSKKEQILT